MLHQFAIIAKVHCNNVRVICRIALARALLLKRSVFLSFTLRMGYTLLTQSQLLSNINVRQSFNKPFVMTNLLGQKLDVLASI